MMRAIFFLVACLLVAVAQVKASASKEIVVNWGIPALQSPPAEKLGPIKANVGDTVVFKWGGGLSYALYQISKQVCLGSEKEFEDTKGLVVKEFNHAKPSGKVSWKAEKVGEYFFVDPDKCGRGVALTVDVAEYKGRRKLSAAEKAAAPAPAKANKGRKLTEDLKRKEAE